MQTLTWAGIPWGKLALGQTGMLCNVQSASLLGSYFVAFLIICFSGYLAIAIAGIKEKLPNGKNVSAIVCALVIFASNFSYGTIAMYEERQYNDPISVAVVQGNATTVEKWNNDTMGMLAAHKELTVAAGKDGADLIVLAETAIPYVINKDEFLTPYIQQMAKEAGSDVILGCLHVDNNGELYNSTRHISASGIISNNTYHKRLEEKVENCLAKHGKCIILDCHSFHDEMDYTDYQAETFPDVCIGVNENVITEAKLIIDIFKNKGYSVKVNEPFAGSIVPLKYIDDNRVKSVMIELNRRIYDNTNFLKVQTIGKEIYNKLG
jgi:hypothetical protein